MSDFFMGAAFMAVALMGAYHLTKAAAATGDRISELEELVYKPLAVPPDERCTHCDGTGQNLELHSPEPFCRVCKGSGSRTPGKRRAARLAELHV